MVGVVVLYLFSWIYDLDLALGNVTYYCIFRLELYRILLSPIVGNSFLNTVILAMFYPAMGMRMESSLGSSLFLWLLGCITIVTNVAFNVCCILMSLMHMPEARVALFYSCSGFWVVLFALITIECMQMPEMPRQMLFIPVQIPSMYFPLVLYVFFSLFTGPQLDFAIAMGVGYAYSKGHLDKLRPSSLYLESLEASGGILHSLSRNRGYMLAGGLGHDAWIATNQTQVTRDLGDGYTRGAYAPVSQAGSASASGGSGGGFGGFGGFGGGGTVTAATEKQESFPGSGQKLASSGLSTAGQSREQIAARRLEKLGGSSQGV